uniref:Uncharacterized protein n=1 Tax=Arundo donax TaxID=35708 RepID=A0A0A9F562_ARUDO
MFAVIKHLRVPVLQLARDIFDDSNVLRMLDANVIWYKTNIMHIIKRKKELLEQTKSCLSFPITI